ncbi:glycoside hydrolase family 2 [Pedobacter sp. HMF7647]|uniref:Glycoside hydrolase family 2 n=1 Tax=Hufsiella arboris TaxID=2695275 RepID=A0A7K1YA68_9SPHI|nr:sugar-binding domain-containing protein [Hufsiella arboris]MXV51472.1 glycoside hydrolase family 2 [Hufsiella arboris]
MSLKKFTTAVIAVIPCFLFAQEWQPKKAVLMTKYAQDVKPDKVLAEYPRPQMQREKWMNLNGLWQFEPGKSDGETLPKGDLASKILVPFPVESALSGVMEHHERIWYKRKFIVPVSWKGEKILLHFGAVDYESEVFVNGKSLGKHTGGYDPFSFDITPYVKGSGEQELAVRVFDPTDNGGFPRGKQTLHPQGIMYTSVTGIWQTVWMEPVPQANINDIKIVPDIDKSVVKLTVSSDASGATVNVKIKEGGKEIEVASGKPNTEISVPVPNAKLWSPDSPFLYDLDISLTQNGKTTDHLSSYFGMRKISVGEEDGYKKLFLNNKFLFQLGPLDQGFWPDGGYTAPTDEALRYDLEMIKKFGYNMVRKHIKVEPYRWYYWADKLGILVWQDMPSANSYTEHTPPVDTVAYASELTRIVKTHINSPSIVTWVVFNEGQGQHNTRGLVDMVRKLDPSRLINQASGGGHFGAGDFLDIHSYPPPAVPSSKDQILACGEYGGIGFIKPGHIWKSGPTYIMIDNEKDYTDLYDQYATDLAIYRTNKGLSAAVYTEITDVEVELNGLLTYDRAVVKGAVEKISASNRKAISEKLYLKDVLPSSQNNARNWKYTFTKPDENWFAGKFNDASWKSGEGGFGTSFTPGSSVKTVWDTKDIWIRQEFTLGDLENINFDDLALYMHHDENCEVYINGVEAAVRKDVTGAYGLTPMSDASKKALIPNGKNMIAIHCHQENGGQYIDAGIVTLTKEK